MLNKYGYGGKGLGKRGDGIIDPIIIQKKTRFEREEVNTENRNIIDRGLGPTFMQAISKEEYPTIKVHKWSKNTILIATDSIYNQIDEKRLSRKYNVRVRAFSGASVEDMYWYLYPLLKKEPDYVILHVGTNNCTYDTPEDILCNILRLKQHIQAVLPNCQVILSQPIIRTDSKKAASTMHQLISLFNELNVFMLDNSNIGEGHLGKKGHHLNTRGTSRLAMNLISFIRNL